MADEDSKSNAMLLVAGAAVALGLGYVIVEGKKLREEREELETQVALNAARDQEVQEILEALMRAYPRASDEEIEEMARAPGGPLDQLDDKYRALGLRG